MIQYIHRKIEESQEMVITQFSKMLKIHLLKSLAFPCPGINIKCIEKIVRCDIFSLTYLRWKGKVGMLGIN